MECEIELLFKNFGITKHEIVASKTLRTMLINKSLQMRRVESNDTRNQVKSMMINEGQLTINDLPSYVKLDIELLIGLNVEPNDFKNLIAQALDAAIKELLPIVIHRSVSIPMITTREIVLKDFALEPDEKKLNKGVNLFIQNLAGSLALVISRDPLKTSFQGLLKTLLEKVMIDENTKENIIQKVSMDNLDLGCALIKKAVVEKALDDVNKDPILIEAIERRKIMREKTGPFYDEACLRMAQQLPEPLRPTLGGLTRDQLKIYDDFGKVLKFGYASRAFKRLDQDSLLVVQKFEQCKFT